MHKSASELVATNLKNVAKVRLSNMSDEKLEEIFDEYVKIDDAGDEPPPKPPSRTELIDEILKRKKAAAERPPSPLTPPPPPPPAHELPDGETTKLIPSGHDGVALEVTVAKPCTSTRVFKERHELRVCSFNSLKLRIGKAGLQDQWISVMSTLATFDVVLVQEVPAEASIKDVEKTRAYLLKSFFEHQTNDKWDIVLSDPCGPGNLEVHVALVRGPIEVLAYRTHAVACGVPLDHAPLMIKLKDNRFKDEGDRVWVLTSVHFPPSSRKKDRDAQLKGFFQEYARSSDFRLDTPLTEKGAKDARVPTVHHMICGDFNVHVGAGYGIGDCGFAPPLLGELVSTSAGGKSLDNFVLSKFAANKFSIGVDVLELTMHVRDGSDGVSDHSPIVVKIRDTASKTSSPKAAKADQNV